MKSERKNHCFGKDRADQRIRLNHPAKVLSRCERRGTARYPGPNQKSQYSEVPDPPLSSLTNSKNRDDGYLAKLQALGMTSSDETKLLALRDYTLKLANATSSFASRLSSEPDTGMSLKVVGNIELQKLGCGTADGIS